MNKMNKIYANITKKHMQKLFKKNQSIKSVSLSVEEFRNISVYSKRKYLVI